MKSSSKNITNLMQFFELILSQINAIDRNISSNLSNIPNESDNNIFAMTTPLINSNTATLGQQHFAYLKSQLTLDY